MGTLPRAAWLWAIGGIPMLLNGQAVDVASMDYDYAYPPQYQDVASSADPYYTQPQQFSHQQAGRYFLAEELDQMLAPIALYPDSLLGQVLMAATYPLEVVQADRWVKANAHFTTDEAARALEVEPWDPSVKSLVNFPDVLTMLSEHLDWTQQLGDAFLSQPQDVADSVQRLRASAWNSGNLASTEQQIVYVQQQAPTPIIVIEPAVPDVIYVPVYDPVVYGYWPHAAYPPYRCYPRGYVGTPVLSFGIGRHCGFAWGYAWGRWDWDHRGIRIDVDINIGRNSFINPTRYASCRYPDATWRHDPVHRRSVPYRSDRVALDHGGSAGVQTVHSRDGYRTRSADTLLERLGSADLSRSNSPNRESGERVTYEPKDRNPISDARREPQKEIVSRAPRSPGDGAAGDRQTAIGGERIAARDGERVPTVGRERTPAVDQNRNPGISHNRAPDRRDDNVAYLPAQPVASGDRDPRSSNIPAAPHSSRLPQTSEPLSREPRAVDITTREPWGPGTRDQDRHVDGNRDFERTTPPTRTPPRPDFTGREPVRVQPERREPTRITPQMREPLSSRSPQREPMRIEPRTSSIGRPAPSGNVGRSPASTFEELIHARPEFSKDSDRGLPGRSSTVGSSKVEIGKVGSTKPGTSKVGSNNSGASKTGTSKLGTSKTNPGRPGPGKAASHDRHKTTRR